MKVKLFSDEWYPFYSLEDETFSCGTLIEVSEEFKAKHDRIMSELEELQAELRELK